MSSRWYFALIGSALVSGTLATDRSSARPGSADAPLVAPAAPSAVIDQYNSGYSLERSECLTINLGPSAAAECGSLRVVHPLPGVRVFNKQRTPVLLYGSDFAHPYPLANVLVTMASTTDTPDSVEVKLSLYYTGQVKATRRWAGTEWPSGQTTTRRLTIGWDAIAAGDTTGYYLYQLDVSNIYGSTPIAAPPVIGAMFVINRSTSPYGAGWSLAGVGRLINNHVGADPVLWIGGDGSARWLMHAWWTTDNIWLTPTYDRVDTLKYDGVGTWRVEVGEAAFEEYDNSGRHLRTIDRLGQVTTFSYTGPLLSSITLPSPTGLTYYFTYTGGQLTSVTAPPIGSTTRITQITNSSGKLTSITDPGAPAVNFDYETATGKQYLMAKRVDRRSVVDTFTYDSARKVASSRIKMGGSSPDIVWTISASESRGLPNSGTPSSADTAKVYTKIDGPRSVADTTVVFQQRFGPPRRIVDALGNTTVLNHVPTSGGLTFGWLVSRLARPGGQKLLASYDVRGNITHLIDSIGVSPTIPDTTRYRWDGKFDQLTGIVPPERDSIVFSVNASNGRREWQEDARGSTSRITFGYDPTYVGQVTSMTLPAVGGPTATYSYTYHSTLRNLDRVTTPKGFITNYTNDQIGRVTIVQSPIDSTLSSTRKVEHHFAYDTLDRVKYDTTLTVNVTPSEKIIVRNFYNAEGQLDSLQRWTDPDPKSIGTVANRWRYDNAGRTVAAIAPDGKVDSTLYDEAGNPVTLVTRRWVSGQSSSMQPIVMTYDILNRLETKVLPAFSYTERLEGIPFWLTSMSPYPAYAIPADTLRYTYTVDGQIDSANNKYARIKRNYSIHGRLLDETLKITNVAANDFSLHAYLTQVRYDRNGRRKALKVPSQLVNTGQDSIRFTYTNWGALEHVYDLFGNDLVYSYNARSEPTQLNRASASVVQKWLYDSDARVVADTVDNNGGTTFPRWAFSRLRATVQKYDGRDRVLLREDPKGSRDTLIATYSWLGHMLTSKYVQKGLLTAYDSTLRSVSTESPTYDPLGNITGGTFTDTVSIHSATVNYDAMSTRTRNVTYRPAVGRDTVDALGTATRFLSYDAAGNNAFTSLVGGSNSASEDRASFYDAAGRLVAADWRWVASQSDQSKQKTAFEEYRYDALGRRVWTRAQRGCLDIYNLEPPYIAPASLAIECRLSFIRRTVWDGDQEIAEINAPGGTSQSALWEQDTGYVNVGQLDFQDPNPFYGRVLYSYGLSLDQPLSIGRFGYADYPDGGTFTQWPAFVILPTWDLEGRPVTGTFADGAAVKQYQSGGNTCVTSPLSSPQRCVWLFWPFSWSAYDQKTGIRPMSWHGSLLENKRDYAGTYYRRNRVYDPATGRFTQEDPIGLAGGMNLYGFAGGDPVNFSDPFGLCTPWPDCLLQSAANWGAQRGGALGWTVLNVAAAANAAAEAFSVNDLGRAVAEHDVGGGALALASMLPVGRGAGGLAKGIAKTIKRAQGAEVTFSQLGKFTRAVWEVAGDKGAGYVRWNRVLDEEGNTIRLFKDVYDQGGKFLRRDPYVGPGVPK